MTSSQKQWHEKTRTDVSTASGTGTVQPGFKRCPDTVMLKETDTLCSFIKQNLILGGFFFRLFSGTKIKRWDICSQTLTVSALMKWVKYGHPDLKKRPLKSSILLHKSSIYSLFRAILYKVILRAQKVPLWNNIVKEHAPVTLNNVCMFCNLDTDSEQTKKGQGTRNY